jgi:predicted glycogen debranching enzyme
MGRCVETAVPYSLGPLVPTRHVTTAEPLRTEELRRAADVPWDADGWHRREWVLADGRGGYACGDALDLPTRRYHSWLTVVGGSGTAARRVRLLAGVDERVDCGDGEESWSAAHWAGSDEPSVPALFRRFCPEPAPTWTRSRGDVALERSLTMPGCGRCVIARWRNTGELPLRLVVRPLFDFVDADSLSRERPLDAEVHSLPAPEQAEGARALQPDPGMPRVCVSWQGGVECIADPCWYRNYHLEEERARGYDSSTDRLAPVQLVIELAPGQVAHVAFSVGEPLADPKARFDDAVRARQDRLAWADRGAAQALAGRLRRGVDVFFHRDDRGRLGVLAGYPWFGEWGRDMFLALPGLTLAVDEPDRCLEVLQGSLPFLRDGILPNIYGNRPDDSRYNSADAALWFTLAVQRYQTAMQAAPDAADSRAVASIDAMFGDALVSIAESYLAGAPLGLFVDDDLLLHAGTADLNATWMDAMAADGPVTPRNGQPVEIVALWCSLLSHLAELRGGAWRKRAAKARKSFLSRFWDGRNDRLYDLFVDGAGDPTLRPNMVLAAALPQSPLTQVQRQKVVDAAAPLVTPRGLRTLGPGEPCYRPRYAGECEERDRSYHQGTVWPWLGGFYCEASLRAAPMRRRAGTRTGLLAWLQGFLPAATSVGFDHVSEVFDAEPPHRPGGTFAQAWNTGELLRALRMCRDGAPADPGSAS